MSDLYETPISSITFNKNKNHEKDHIYTTSNSNAKFGTSNWKQNH